MRRKPNGILQDQFKQRLKRFRHDAHQNLWMIYSLSVYEFLDAERLGLDQDLKELIPAYMKEIPHK